MIQLEFQHVNFCYAESQEEVLRDISFQIHAGEFILLCGASGCGKTTLLRHAIKSQIPIGNGSGRLLYQGENIETMDDIQAVRQIAYVGQQPENQIVTDTVWHELAFGMESLGEPVAEIRKRTAEIAEYFGMGDFFRRKTAELSGGQKQLVNLASAMVLRPRLLILDEPTSQLDPAATERFLDILSKLHRDLGVTVLLSEQRLERTLPMADRVMVMEDGRLAAVMAPEACAEPIRESAGRIYPALPVASRVYLESGGSGESPMAMAQGRQYLRQKVQEQEEDKNRYSVEEMIKTEPHSRVWQGGHRNKSSEPGPAIELKDVRFCYPETEKEILRDLSWQLPAGSLYGILGGNGSGKTTALKIMAGIYSPNQGTCVASGKILYLPQNPKAVLTEVSVEEELAELLARRGMPKKEIISKAEGMLSVMELRDCRHSHPYDLSGGQMQRLALAKALLLEPEVLLLDEPTKGLDAAFKSKLGEYLQQIRKQGTTVLVVSHDIEFCAEYMTHCALLFDGEIIQCGETGDFFAGNYFYNTAAARMAEGILPDVLTVRDILEQLRE